MNARVPLGGTRLHAEIFGAGGPVIVFEAGSGADGSVWRNVVAELGVSVRAFAYDRAGIGFSPETAGPVDAASAARELTRALDVHGLCGPAVVVAHSLGALIARAYALASPARVAALVLVDPVHEDMHAGLASDADPDAPHRRLRRAMRAVRWIEWLAAAGVLRPMFRVLPGVGAGLRLTRHRDVGAALGDPARWRTIRRAAAAFARSGDCVRGQALGSIPLIVLTATSLQSEMRRASALPRALFMERWRALHEEIAALSTAGRRFDVECGHNIHLERPAMVACAIRQALVEIGASA